MNKTYLLLGGNIGNTKAYVNAAIESIKSQIGTIVLQSSLYETAPWGFTHEQHFLNQVVLVETTQSPREVLIEILKIEQRMGRKRDTSQWGERIIDIDILFFNEQVIAEDQLHIPHPRLHERRFTLEPLYEIAGSFVHPLLRKTVHELRENCTDPLEVKIIS